MKAIFAAFIVLSLSIFSTKVEAVPGKASTIDFGFQCVNQFFLGYRLNQFVPDSFDCLSNIEIAYLDTNYT